MKPLFFAIGGAFVALSPTASATSLSLAPSVVGWQASARHLVLPAAHLQLLHHAQPVSFGAELLVARHSTGDRGLYEYNSARLRLAALMGWSGGSGPFTVHLGAGPGLAARLGPAQVGDHRISPVVLAPGLRARVALEGPIGDRLVWTWQSGAMARIGGLDWDCGIGLGVVL